MSSAETAGISAEAGGRGGAKGKAGGVCEKESEAGKALLSLLIDKEGGGGAGGAGGGGGGAKDPQLHGDEEQEDASPATLPSAHKRSGSPGMFGKSDGPEEEGQQQEIVVVGAGGSADGTTAAANKKEEPARGGQEEEEEEEEDGEIAPLLPLPVPLPEPSIKMAAGPISPGRGGGSNHMAIAPMPPPDAHLLDPIGPLDSRPPTPHGPYGGSPHHPNHQHHQHHFPSPPMPSIVEAPPLPGQGPPQAPHGLPPLFGPGGVVPLPPAGNGGNGGSGSCANSLPPPSPPGVVNLPPFPPLLLPPPGAMPPLPPGLPLPPGVGPHIAHGPLGAADGGSGGGGGGGGGNGRAPVQRKPRGRRAGPTKEAVLGSEGQDLRAVKEASTRWSREEDAALKKAVDELGPRDWKRISDEFLGGKRSEAQCYQRWDRTIRADIKTGPWTPEEDAILTRCVVEEGMTKWSDIAKRIPGRLSKRIRERWTCQLNPQRLSKEVAPWTPEEIETLFMAKEKLGNKWVEIAKLLPGRTENDVKNRAYCEMRKRKRKETKSQIARQKFLIKKAMAARPKLTAEEAGGAGAEEGDDPALRPTKIFISHILEASREDHEADGARSAPPAPRAGKRGVRKQQGGGGGGGGGSAAAAAGKGARGRKRKAAASAAVEQEEEEEDGAMPLPPPDDDEDEEDEMEISDSEGEDDDDEDASGAGERKVEAEETESDDEDGAKAAVLVARGKRARK